MEKYTKLVRDKIPEILDQKGVVYEKRTASPEELKSWLVEKLKEEIGEFTEDKSVEELADVVEVINALKKLPEFADVEKVREEKAKARGAFNDGIILTGEK